MDKRVVFNLIMVILAGLKAAYPDLVIPEESTIATLVDSAFVAFTAAFNIWLYFKMKKEKPSA